MADPGLHGPFGRAWVADLVVVDPLGVLLDASAAERARWGWWARRVGADPATVLADAARLPTPAVVARHAPTGLDRAAEEAALIERLTLLLRTVRRTRGAAALLRALPRGRAATWTRAGDDELERLAGRARIALPEPRLTALGGGDGPDRAAAFLAEIGRDPSRVVAIEGSEDGAARARALGCHVVRIAPAGDGASPVGAAGAGTDGPTRLTDVAQVAVRPDPDGVVVSLRRESRLR